MVWVALALLFNFLLYQFALWKFPQDPRLQAIPGFDPTGAAWRVSLEFLTGYIVEKSLSVDNIFVFVLVFGYFAIPPKYQHRVLFYGIIARQPVGGDVDDKRLSDRGNYYCRTWRSSTRIRFIKIHQGSIKTG